MASHQDRAFEDLRNSLSEYAHIIRYRWRVGLLALGIVSTAAFWSSQYLPREYAATTLFERRDDVVLQNLIQSRSPYSFSQLRASMALDMTGTRAMADAAIELGLLPANAVAATGPLSNEDMRKLDEALSRHNLSAKVKLVQSSDTVDTIELTSSANNPQLARRLVTVLRDHYIHDTSERIREVLVSSRSFFESELARYDGRVAQVNNDIKKLTARFPGVNPRDPSSAGTRLETLRSDRMRLMQDQAELEAQIGARERFLSQVPSVDGATATSASAGALPGKAAAPLPPTLPETPAMLQRSIEAAELEIADAITVRRMTAEHPAVRALYKKLDALYAMRSDLLKNGMTSAPQSGAGGGGAVAQAAVRQTDPQWYAQKLRVEMELDALRSQLAIVKTHVEESSQRLEQFNDLYESLLAGTANIQELEERLEANLADAAVWRDHLAQLNRVLAAENDERGTQFAVLEDPKEAVQPIRPLAMGVMVVCSGFGLAAAALLVALSELLDRSFRSAGQVTRVLSLPILECVGEIQTPRVRRRKSMARLVWTPTVMLVLLALFTSAGLTYASLRYPNIHRTVVTTMDRFLESVGLPPTGLVDQAV